MCLICSFLFFAYVTNHGENMYVNNCASEEHCDQYNTQTLSTDLLFTPHYPPPHNRPNNTMPAIQLVEHSWKAASPMGC